MSSVYRKNHGGQIPKRERKMICTNIEWCLHVDILLLKIRWFCCTVCGMILDTFGTFFRKRCLNEGFLHCFRSTDVEPEGSIKTPQTRTFTQISTVRIWIQETSWTEPTKLRNQSWDKRRGTIRKCQVVALEFVQTIVLWLEEHWHFSALHRLHTNRHTLNVRSRLSAKRYPGSSFSWQNRKRWKYLHKRVRASRQPCPARVARSLVQIPPAWRKESRALPGFRLGGGQSGSWIPESLRSRLSLRGGASQLRRAQETFGPPGPWDRRIRGLTFNTSAVSSCHHLPRGIKAVCSGQFSPVKALKMVRQWRECG